MTEEKLQQSAREMLSRAYSPYSHFAVGAALEGEDGSVYTGCNVENASYGMTLCAERVAVGKAVSQGCRKFRRIVIAADSREHCYPCGACRQVLAEFSPEMEVLCLNGQGDCRRFLLKELLPCGFDGDFL